MGNFIDEIEFGISQFQVKDDVIASNLTYMKKLADLWLPWQLVFEEL